MLYLHSNTCWVSSSDIPAEPEYIKSRVSKCCFYFRFTFFAFRFPTCRLSSYFDILAAPECQFSNVKMIVWFSFFDICADVEYQVLNVRMLFWHSSRWRISNSDIPAGSKYIKSRISNFFSVFVLVFICCVSTFGLRPIIKFWMSKCYFDIRTDAEYQVLTFQQSKNISSLECQNLIVGLSLNVEIRIVPCQA